MSNFTNTHAEEKFDPKRTPNTNFHELPGEISVDELIMILKIRFSRLKTALKFQFHEKTFHIFKRIAVRRATVLGFTGLFLWNVEPEFLGKIGRPIVSVFQNDGRRITDDYPLATNSMVNGAIFGSSTPKAKTTSGKAFLGGDGGNAAAPVGVSQLREQSALEYIEKYAPIAKKEMTKFGIPASISLAQGLVESRAGTSRLAKKNNNHFGIKCFSKRCAKGHCTNATDDHHKDFFRKYKSAWESWREHSQLLAGGHYSRLQKCGSDYRQWAYGLKSLGYATDKTYAEKLIGMIERYELYKYDR
jgi:hypothetical protein